MPIYEFLNTKSKLVEEHSMPVADYDVFKENNPHLERYYGHAPAFSYSGTGDFQGKKTDNTWKEVMSKIAEAHPVSALAEQYGNNESVKRKKSREVIKQHINKNSKK
jgi:hypothetical protein